MTQPVKKYFLFFITVLAGFFMSLQPLTVSAQSIDSLHTIDHLYNQKRGSERVDVTDSYYFSIVKNLNPNFSNDEKVNSEAFKRDYAKALNHGTILLLQFSSMFDNVPYGYMNLYFNFKRDCNVKLFWRDSSYRLYTDSSDSDCSFRRAAFDAYPIANYYASPSSLSGYVIISSKDLSIFSYSGEYTVDESAKGASSLPKAKMLNPEAPSFGWNDNCGLDVVCHLGNIGNAVKTVFSLVLGIFDFSENNTILRFFKWLFLPDDLERLLDFSDMSRQFNKSLGPVYSSIELLEKIYKSLFPRSVFWSISYYCSTSPVGDAGVQDSASHRYILRSAIFGHKFEPDICSFERVVGGFDVMAQIRNFTGIMLLLFSIFLWYRFIIKITEARV